MTASLIKRALERSLSRKNGPEIVVVMTHLSHGFIERIIMGANRDRLIRRLKRSDRFDRLRVFYPCVSDAAGQSETQIHSKLMIIDDRLLRVGSANLNNRSFGVDSECDLSVETSDPAVQKTIRRIRNTLLAEHLGCAQAELDRASEQAGLIGAIEALSHGPRTLRAFGAMKSQGPVRPVIGTTILDPKRPLAPMSSRWRRARSSFARAFTLASGEARGATRRALAAWTRWRAGQESKQGERREAMRAPPIRELSEEQRFR
jgi:phospholipase D1/2